MAIYLDCNATTPMEPAVIALVQRFMERDFGNAASPVHDYGQFARMAVEHARGQVAELLSARRDEVIFTSGATEANNMAILGLLQYGVVTGRRHLISTAIEHKAVLEPLSELERLGFELELLPVDAGGRVDPASLGRALRPDTLLVSTMQVNNETGIIQPISELSGLLEGHPAFWHVDAAQGFGKEIEPLKDRRIDLTSISGHKIYGPKGVGALVVRKRDNGFPPLAPLMYGGGQEQGLRPGTLPVMLIAGLGEAAKLARLNHLARREYCLAFRRQMLEGLAPVAALINGDERYAVSNAINISLPGVSSDRVISALKGLIAISSTSACTSHTRTPSHVLAAMGFDQERVESSIRLSWSHLTVMPDWKKVVEVIQMLRNSSRKGGGDGYL